MMMISVPTSISNVRAWSFLHNTAAKGAAKRPPNTKPTMIGQVLVSISNEKTAALINVRKNSAKLTEPMVVRGSLPELTNVDVTTGPQPPPPPAFVRVHSWTKTDVRRLV